MICKVNGITINYKVYGEGYPVLMLHGYYADHRLMEGCMEPIFKKRDGWKRIYIDLPGMGETKTDISIQSSDEMLDTVIKFIEEIIPSRNFLIAGESYGGYLARGLIAKKKEFIDGMLLICPVVIANKDLRNTPDQKLVFEDKEFMNSLNIYEGIKYKSMAVVQSQKTWERFKNEVLTGMLVADNVFLNRMRKSEGYTFSFSLDEFEKAYTRPVLIITGRQDSIVGYRDAWDIVEKYPRATFAVLDRAGHNLQIEQDSILEVMVNEWINRVVENLEALA